MKNLDPEVQFALKQFGEFVKFVAMTTVFIVLILFTIYIL
jgi:hypothetical protein